MYKNKNDATEAERLVRRTIREYKLPPKSERILVGFSGGSDSVCLLDILYNMGYNVVAAHLNHNMRPTAERDMRFCQGFCDERGIELKTRTVTKNSIKSEADARDVRYRFFAEIMSECGIEYLATAHNKNDSAETVLLHLMRGASTDGLCGILPMQKNIIRPLIAVKKCEVLAYCREKGLEYMTDETNLTDVYSRNRLRNRFIPELEAEFNRSLIDVVADNALLTADDGDFLRKSAEEAFERAKLRNGIKCASIAEMHPAIKRRCVLLLWRKSTGREQNLSRIYTEKILELAVKCKSGSSINLPSGFTARIDYGVLEIVKPFAHREYEYKIKMGEWCKIKETGMQVGVFAEGDGLPVSLDGGESLAVRSRRNGDRFVPSGMKGSKKLSDYFTDIKLPSEKRDTTPIFLADGEIMAVGKYRSSELFSKGKRAEEYVIKIVW